MQEYHSEIAVVLAMYRVLRAIELAQAITGEASDLVRMRDAVVRYIPAEQQLMLLPLIDGLIEGRMLDMEDVQMALHLIQQLDDTTRVI